MQQQQHTTKHCSVRTIAIACSSPAHSESDSNDYIACLRNYYIKMAERDKEAAQWNDPNLQMTFANALVDFKTDKLWTPTVRAQSNRQNLADHVNHLCTVNLIWD